MNDENEVKVEGEEVVAEVVSTEESAPVEEVSAEEVSA